MPNGRADRDELGEVAAPFVAADVEPNTDDAVRSELVRLLLHARHRQLAGVVHRLREHVHLLVRAPATHLETDVVDRAADHEAERLESRGLDEEELVDREIAGEEAPLAHPREAFPSVLGDTGGRGRVVLLAFLIAHRCSPLSGRPM